MGNTHEAGYDFIKEQVDTAIAAAGKVKHGEEDCGQADHVVLSLQMQKMNLQANTDLSTKMDRKHAELAKTLDGLSQDIKTSIDQRKGVYKFVKRAIVIGGALTGACGGGGILAAILGAFK